QGEPVEDDQGRRKHGLGQCGGEEGAQLGKGRCLLMNRHPGHQPRLSRGAGTRSHHGLAHLRVADEGGLDLPELDAVAADLHLAVDAPEVFEIAVRQPAGEIPRAVEARAGSPPGIGNEALRRQLRPPEISRCNPLSPDGDLARDADGLGREAAVDDVQREIGDGSAENAAGRQVASPDGPTVTWTVVSVMPYMLTRSGFSSPWRSNQGRRAEGSKASPPKITNL